MNISAMIIKVWLPLLVISFIALEVVIVPMLGDKKWTTRRNIAKLFFVLTTLFVIFSYREIIEEPVIYQIRGIFEKGITFKIDLLNYPFIILAGIMWIVIGVYNLKEINYFFYTITFIATIGTLIAGDLISFFLFFEIMTFSSYALMVYHCGEEQLEAGYVYIYMGIIGGLSILSGILMVSAYTGSFEWTHLAESFAQMGRVKYAIAAFFVAGFGIKAAMFPFHFWVPRIYAGAPFSINALSSGVLMKIGAYGIIKVISILFSANVQPGLEVDMLFWQISNNIGVIIIWLGILSMVVGVFMALQQGNMKRMLAYHSVSQMGYIIMGIGVASYLGYQGAMGVAGSIYHMVNHSFFKALLFMVAGIVYMRTREINMYELGGLWRKMPITAALCLIAVFGITGMPGFNGFASKSILHHAIVEAYDYGHPSFKYAEWLFKLVSAGTVCSFIKFFGYIFLGEEKEKYSNIQGDHTRRSIAMAVFAVVIIAIGIVPSFLLDKIIIPITLSLSYDPVFIEKYIVGLNFWAGKEIIGMIGIYALGFGIFAAGTKYHLFHINLPKWADSESIVYKSMTTFLNRFADACVRKYEKKIVFGDVWIYAIMLTFILLSLIVSGIWVS